MLTPHEQLVKTIAHRSVNVLVRIYGTLCGSQKIPGRPPMVQLDHVDEGHCFEG